MIDLHCHILPAIDDGADCMETSLKMARIAVEDGIELTACTPHIYPGMYDNHAHGIADATSALADELKKENIPLALTYASDTHVMPDLVDRLRAGTVPTFNQGRYFLLEFPHHTNMPNLESYVFNLLAAGYIPVITHPERLHWLDKDNYSMFKRMADSGAWMQITAGSLTGRFGENAKRWGMRFLDEGYIHILATDAHNTRNRSPRLAEAYHVAEKRLGQEEAMRLVKERPLAMLNNLEPDEVTPIPAKLKTSNQDTNRSIFAKMLDSLGIRRH